MAPVELEIPYRLSGAHQMLEHFGAPRYDLYGVLASGMRLHPEFAFSFLRAPASIMTTSFADTLQIARFIRWSTHAFPALIARCWTLRGRTGRPLAGAKSPPGCETLEAEALH